MRAIAIVILLGTTAHAAPAEPAPDGRKWRLGIEAMTDFPLYVGAQLWVELPYRIRLSTSFGEMPDTYLDTINAIATSAGAYDQTTAELLSEVLDHAFTWRLHIGWRPFKRRGGYIEAGYGMMSLAKGFTVADILQQATGISAPQEANIGFGYKVNTVVETLGVEIGWMWYPWRSLTVRVALGFAAAVGAQVDIEPNFLSRAQEPFTRLAGDYVQDLIKKYLLVPTVGVAVGWRLF